MQTTQNTAPIAPSERIHQLDVLRGVAVFGILVVNVEQMFLPGFYATDPVAAIPGAWGGLVAWFLTDALFENKFLTLFSLLFGAGFALQFDRASARGDGFGRRYVRRLLALVVFGVVHAVFFYSADVLVIYALTALFLLPWRRAKARKAMVVACCLLALTIAWGTFVSGPDSPDTSKQQRLAVEKVAGIRQTGQIDLPEREFGLPRTIEIQTDAGWSLTDEGRVHVPASSYELPMPSDLAILVLDGNEEMDQAQVEYSVFSEGPLGAARFARVSFFATLIILYLPVYVFWRTLALFLIGLAAVRAGLLEAPRTEFWQRLRRIGLGLGLPMTLIASALRFAHHDSQSDWLYVGHALHDGSSLLLASGIAASVWLWAAGGLRTGALRRLAAVGRTALTNYIGQSVVMSLVATSYGLGLYGDLSRVQLFALAVVCFALQTVVSSWWLDRFRMGPLEWIWRCFTYWRIVPLRARS